MCRITAGVCQKRYRINRNRRKVVRASRVESVRSYLCWMRKTKRRREKEKEKEKEKERKKMERERKKTKLDVTLVEMRV